MISKGVMQINWLDIVALGKKVESFLVWSWLEEQTYSERQQTLQEVMDLLMDGTLRPPEGAVAAVQCDHTCQMLQSNRCGAALLGGVLLSTATSTFHAYRPMAPACELCRTTATAFGAQPAGIWQHCIAVAAL